MSHTTEAALGTTFIHNVDFSGDVDVISVSWPDIGRPDGTTVWSVAVPFEDLRELVFAYLRARRTERAERATDDQFEIDLIT